jgi:hypothetical protein
MFGGIGLYQAQRFFGIITSDTLYFKVNEANRGDYRARAWAAKSVAAATIRIKPARKAKKPASMTHNRPK